MIYFDNAATSVFKPKKVLKAAAYALKHSANPGRSSHDQAIRTALMIQRAREEILSFVHAKHHVVTFTKNCTEALNLALLGTAKLGGHVITTAFEHNSVLRPLHMLKKEGLISLTVLKPTKDGALDVKEIENAINEKTYLVAVTGMSNVTGYVPPLSEIGEVCSKYGLLFSVDGAQSLGHEELDLEKCGVDLLSGAGHKGLHGAQGTGFLVSNKKVFVNPIEYGGTGTESDKLTQPTLPPESLESGTLNSVGIAALAEGIRWTKKHFDKINGTIREISLLLHEEIGKIQNVALFSVPGSPILTFDVCDKDPGAVADKLNSKYKIAVRSGLHCAPLIHQSLGSDKRGLIRASLGCNNTRNDAKALIRAIRAIAAEARSTE